MPYKMDPKEHSEFGTDDKQTEVLSTPEIESKGLSPAGGGLPSDEVVLQYDKHEARRILRKIDYRLVPLLGLLYL